MTDDASNTVFTYLEPTDRYDCRIEKCSFWLSDRGNRDKGRIASYLALIGSDRAFSYDRQQDATLCSASGTYD